MDTPTTIMFHIDSRNTLSDLNDELIQVLHWLLARRDLAAFEKLYPIVRRITDLILASLKGPSRKFLALATRSIGSSTR
jgi:hypothetical protein